jgi:hypothetical protein
VTSNAAENWSDKKNYGQRVAFSLATLDTKAKSTGPKLSVLQCWQTDAIQTRLMLTARTAIANPQHFALERMGPMARDKEMRRLANWPRRTMEQAEKLAKAGWYPFPELSEAENDEIFCARLAGFGLCSAAYPDAEAQARRTLANARRFLESTHATH